MRILAIDTSCDETSAAVVEGRRVLASVVYSQTQLHKKWGGVMPSVAKRAHQERLEPVVNRALQKAGLHLKDIEAVAVTVGPGLAIALEVGIAKAKDISVNQKIPFIAVNHMEGHIYSCFVQNSKGNPERPFAFPYLALLVSGGHTEIVRFTSHLEYEVIGRTTDDAVGEALDKAAKILGYGYPGGPLIETLAEKVENRDVFQFPRPMLRAPNLDMSFSGLKTSFLYKVRSLSDQERAENLYDLASSYQEAAFDTVVKKLERAVKKTGYTSIVVGGGVAINQRLRTLLKKMISKYNGTLYFPTYKYLNFDNAAMIGVAASFKAERHLFVEELTTVERQPRLSFPAFQTVEQTSTFLKERTFE